MGISEPNSKPNLVEGGLVDQNELGVFNVGTRTSHNLTIEKIQAELSNCKITLLL